MSNKPKHVAVLMGGWSSEREVSLVSGASCVEALKRAGYIVTPIDAQRDVGGMLSHLYPRPDVVFNALHGRFGEDGSIQGILDIMNLPYTHSGLLASAVAMDKVMSKKLFAQAGIPVAADMTVTRDQVLAGHVMEPPYVIKPANEGSSVGIHIVRKEDMAHEFDGESWPYGETVMVEKFIPGRELTVAVMGDKALGVTEIFTDHDFYDYEAKYAKGGSSHKVPADIPKDLAEEVQRLAVLAHEVLGCRGVTRSDFRYDGDKLYILELNTQPGMTPTSLVPEQAQAAGISFEELVTWMVEHAECDA